MEKYTPSKYRAVKNLCCPACGSQNINEKWVDDCFEFGEGENLVKLSAYLPLCECTECDLNFTDWRGEEIRHNAICDHLKILNPSDIVEVREKNGLTQQQMAEISRIGRASLARWEKGAIFQNGSSDSLIYLLKFPENINRLRERSFGKQDISISIEREEFRFRALSNSSVEGLRREASSFNLH